MTVTPSSPRVVGIINATPDSFSDGGQFLDVGVAAGRANMLTAQGADILDIGGESTRPGADPVTADQEIARVIPVIEAIGRTSATPISIDTMKPVVARAAITAGAVIWNDITALTHSPDSLDAAAGLCCEVVLMHMQRDPRTMQANPTYGDVVADVIAFLAARAEAAMAAGVARHRIWLDPGIGFGKTLAHNLALLANMDRLVALGFPVMLGASRKGFIRRLDTSAGDPGDRLGGSLAAVLAGADAGVAAVRVHDVRATVQALAVRAAIGQARGHG